MTYPERTGHLRNERPLWGQQRREQHLAHRQRTQRVLRVVKAVTQWLRRYWWVVLVWILAVLFILVACPRVGAIASAQAASTYVDRDPWRTGIVGGFHMLEPTEGPALAWTPPGRPTGQAALDAWIDARPQSGAPAGPRHCE